MEKDSKPRNKEIKGWSTFFLLQLGFCAIVSIMSFISNFELPLSLNFDIDVPLKIRLIGGICMVVPEIFIAGYAILVIRLFIKRKSHAIQLAMSYLLALFLTANIDMSEAILNYDVNIFYLLKCIVSMIWFTIWLIYLDYSKQIEDLFPVSTRVSRKRDYLPMVFIFIPHIIKVSLLCFF